MAVEIATAYVSLVPSFRGGVGAIQKEAGKIGKGLSGSMADEVNKSTRGGGVLSKAFGGIGGALAGGLAIGAGVGAITSLISGFVSEAENAAKVSRQTAAVLKSTGGAANVSAKQIDTLATALSNKSGVDDEVIASGENVLLTFTKVRNETGKGNDIFNQGTKVALDMSAALGTDLQGSVIQVGKALNDPIKGITALQRVGVSFTAQQKEEIKALVEKGDTLGAQKVILRELSTEFGGAAAASATSSQKLGVAWGNIQEQLGTALLPILDKVTNWMLEELPGATKWVQDVLAKFQAFWKQYGDEIMAVVKFLFAWIRTEIKIYVAAIKIEFAALRWIVDFFNDHVKGPLIATVNVLVAVVTAVIKAGVATVRTAWSVIDAVYIFFNDHVKNPVIATAKVLFAVVTGVIQAGVATVRATWSVIEAVYTFFRDRVYNPVRTTVAAMRDAVVGSIRNAVDTAKSVWNGMYAIYSWFVSNVSNPVISAVNHVRDAVGDAFRTAVDVVRIAWDKLKEVVRTPIKAVVDFYNAGIVPVWNAIIGRIHADWSLPRVEFAEGGKVPGSGNRDTVDAKLTPGEFVLTKETTSNIGVNVLNWLNKTKGKMEGTADPGVFGYAGGGQVRSVDEVQAWMWAQAGKPYVFPLSGPNAYDCSGFTSALINFALGASNPYSRRHSSGTVGSDPALAAGDGPDPYAGITIGARPPYTLNRFGHLVGHVTATVGGLPGEATPPAVRVGSGARGFDALPQHYHMKNYAGLSELDKETVSYMKGLYGLDAPSFGGPPMGDLLTKLFTGVPKMIFGFLLKQLPEMIVSAVGKAIGGFLKLITPFDQGGTVRRPGPILVGEHRPEVLWANQGEYVQAGGAGAGIYGIPPVHIHNYTREPTASQISTGIRMAQLQMA